MVPRWRILGELTTTSPLHIGSGGITEHGALNVEELAPNGKDKRKTPCDIQSVVKDYQGKPCIPGTALKGVLRSWAERYFKGHLAIERIFGDSPRDSRSAAGNRTVAMQAGSVWAEAGRAEFCTARVVKTNDLEAFAKFVPYWNPNTLTGIASHVAIDPQTGTAEEGKLFYEEFVPEGVTFGVEIDATRLKEEEIAFFLGVLERGSSHPTHPWQFGASGADGWGRMVWKLSEVRTLPEGAQGPPTSVGFAACTKVMTPALTDLTPSTPHIFVGLELQFEGPLLVNDKSREKTRAEEQSAATNFTALRRANGDVWLPTSSFRGVLRQRAEFLFRSLCGSALKDEGRADTTGDPITRIFGTTSRGSRLTISEFAQTGGNRELRRQDFVAIDRFTGGAAEGAKFDASYADRPTLATKLTLDLDGLAEEDVAILACALRDICRGKAAFGFGTSKGYGVAKGTVTSITSEGVIEDWGLPKTIDGGQTHSEGLIARIDRALQQLAGKTLEIPKEPASSSPAPTVAGGAGASERPAVAPILKGKLVWRAAGKDRKRELREDGKPNPMQLNKPGEIHPDLRNDTTDSIDVEFEKQSGQPVRIRPVGMPWSTAPAAPAGGGLAPVGGQFAHPYYFLHVNDRERFQGELADRPPVGHDKLDPLRYSGTIRVRLTTKTPLLLCDDASASEQRQDDPASGAKQGHKTYPLLMDADGKPLLAASAVRGMLRAAYEAVTNSRFGVFPFDTKAVVGEKRGHARRLGYRMGAGQGLSLVPVRIEQGHARFLLGTNPGLPEFDARRQRWSVPGDLLHAAWMPRYDRSRGEVLVDSRVPRHGQEAWCWLELVKHRKRPFKFWQVRQAATKREELGKVPPPWIRTTEGYESCQEARVVSGYFHISNQNIDRKHDERFFFAAEETLDRGALPIPDQVRTAYVDLVRDYQLIHAEELKKRSERNVPPDRFQGKEPGQTAFSRHTYVSEAAELAEGELCYASVRRVGSREEIEALYPVMISRRIFEKSPLELVPRRLLPARSLDELSPADRVFGWVDQSENDRAEGAVVAHRSQLRVGPVQCTAVVAEAIEKFASPQPLAILGQPKPNLGRFYLGDAAGKAQANGLDRAQSGYGAGRRIRGPKVYPHHQGFDANADGGWKGSERTQQNRSISGWVKPGVTFEFNIDVKNLSRIELGGLVWLLMLPSDHFLRLGLGKPLGFGSVRAEVVEGTTVASGAAWINAMTAWNASPGAVPLEPLRAEFDTAMKTCHGTLLASFLRAAQGFPGLPVHYPRLDSQGDTDTEHFQWFMENDKEGRDETGRRLSLPDLGGSVALPRTPTQAAAQGPARGNGRR